MSRSASLAALLLLVATASLAEDAGRARGAVNPGPIPTPAPPPPPSTANMRLEDAVAHVRSLRDAGASNAAIAQAVSQLVDRRITNVNSVEGLANEFFYLNPVTYVPGVGVAAIAPGLDQRRRIERFQRERESIGSGSRRADSNPGLMMFDRAQWAWDLQAGACAEAAAISFTILHRAGLPVRLLECGAGGGHVFAVLGLRPDYDPRRDSGDPSRWGADAHVVDGWQGRALTPAEAAENQWIGRGSVDQTNRDYNPQVASQWEAQAGKGRLIVMVVDAVTGEGVVGVHVEVQGQSGTDFGSTDSRGWATFTISVGGRDVTALPLPASGLRSARGRAPVADREESSLRLALPRIGLVIVSPISGTQTRDASITISGLVDAPEARTVMIQGGVGDVPAPVSAGTFSATVALSPGFNSIWVALGPARSPSLTIERIGSTASPATASVATGTWTSRQGYGGRVSITLDMAGGSYQATFSGALGASSISGRSSGGFTGVAGAGSIGGGLQFTEATAGQEPWSSGGSLAGTLRGQALLGTFTTEHDSGTFTTTLP